MNFYTKEWKEYVYRSWKDSLPIEYNITNSKLIHDGDCHEMMREWQFEKYYNEKKEYVSLEPKLEKIFGKYEKITLLSENEEKELYFKRIDEFIEKYKAKVLKTIELLKFYNLDIELDINDIDFELLALNKVNPKTKRFYQKLRDAYYEYIKRNDLLTSSNLNYINDIDLIYNNITSFLTSYTEYIDSRNDKDYELINDYLYHDQAILSYEASEDKIIIELEVYDNMGIRLIINNPKVIISKVKKDDKLTEIAIKLNTDKLIDVYDYDYKLYEEEIKHLVIQYCIASEEDRCSGIINVDYYSNSIKAELFIIDEAEYLQYNNIHQNNLKELSNMLSDDTYILLNETCFNKLSNSKIVSYSLDDNLLINFKNNKLEKYVLLKLVDIDIKILKDNKVITKEELENILKEKFERMKQLDNECVIENYYSNLFKNSIKLKKKNNLIEVNIQPTNDIEIIIICNKIAVFDNSFETKIGEVK